MIKKALIAVVLCLLFTTTYAQNTEKIKGDRNVTISEANINSFNRIVVGERFKIDLIEGEQASVFIETDENLHDVISFNVADSTLYFKTTKRITTFKKMSIKVTFTKTLKQIETKEDAEVSSLTSINLDDIVLVHSGNSKSYLNIKTSKFKLINNEKAKAKLNVTTKLATLELNENSKAEALIQADSMEVDLYQRSEAKIEGDVDHLEVRADNSSSFIGRNFTANRASVNCDLNSDVYVKVIDELFIEARGNSEIYIYDTPKITIKAFEGASKLHKKELKK